MKSETDILNGSPIVVKFGGTTYTFTQRSRAEQRNVRTRLAEVVSLLATGESIDATQSILFSVKASNAILEFCEEHNQDFADNIDDIEDYLRESGVKGTRELTDDVFMVLYKEWLEPWFGGGKKKPNRATRRAKPKTTD